MNEAKAGCVLRLFGAPDAAVGAAVGQFPPQWKAAAQWKSRGAETLVALSAQSAAGLKKAVGALRETFSADLYGAGETTLAEAVVAALEGHDRLLICSDAAAGTLLEARLETVPGAEKVFDFGALSYAHPKAGAQIEKRARARLPKGTTDPVRLALARAQAARRVVGADLAAGCPKRRARAFCPPGKPKKRPSPKLPPPPKSPAAPGGCWWFCWCWPLWRRWQQPGRGCTQAAISTPCPSGCIRSGRTACPTRARVSCNGKAPLPRQRCLLYRILQKVHRKTA